MTAPSQAIIRIHSVVDIITNSSTEIFVAATEHTIENVKKLTDALLTVGGSTLTADDLFTFSLNDEGKADYDADFERRLKHAEIKALQNNREFDAEEYREKNYYYENDCSDVKLVVELKEGFLNSPEAETAAKIMSSLTTLFSVGEKYEG